jgi:hypothetical protein
MKRLFDKNEKANSLGFTYGMGIQETLKPFVDLAVEDNVSLRDLFAIANDEIFNLIAAELLDKRAK